MLVAVRTPAVYKWLLYTIKYTQLCVVRRRHKYVNHCTARRKSCTQVAVDCWLLLQYVSGNVRLCIIMRQQHNTHTHKQQLQLIEELACSTDIV